MSDAAIEALGFRKDGGVQVMMATWVDGKGWLVTKTGVSMCGPGPFPASEEAVMLAARGAYRAITHHLKEAADAERV